MSPRKDTPILQRLQEAAFAIRARTPLRPALCLVLGSGLGDFADELASPTSIPSTEIPFYPRSTVPGHAGRVILGSLRKGSRRSLPLIVFQGRVHYYETGAVDIVVFPILLARLLGARILLATNAAGGINRNYRPGDLMAIRDCLSLSLLGVPAVDQIGDTTQAHVEYRGGIQNAARFLMDPAIHALILEQARKERVTLHSGTYCWLQGPSYETAAEIEMLRRVGADAVGMSTVPELITARQQGMKVGALSLISNLATGITPEKLSHADVTATAGSARASFVTLLQSILFRLS